MSYRVVHRHRVGPGARQPSSRGDGCRIEGEFGSHSGWIDRHCAVTGDLLGVSGQKWRRPLAETDAGTHTVALLEMGIQVHWALENVLPYSTRP
jgi:hypothetical protein